MDSVLANWRFFHEHPELGYDLPKTLDRIRSELARLNIDIIEGFCPSALIGLLRSPDDTENDSLICYRADADALPIAESTEGRECCSLHPGCMHACGHDAHLAIALGVAEYFSKRRSSLQKSMAFLFQPNEEGRPGTDMPTGALAVERSGILDELKVSRIYALHCIPELPAGSVSILSGPTWAANATVRINIFGVSSHAAYPHRGKDALVLAAQLVMACYDVLRKNRTGDTQEVFTIYRLQAGSEACAIADKAYIEGTMRAEDRNNIFDMFRLVENTCKTFQDITHLEIFPELALGSPPVYNNKELANNARQILRQNTKIKLVDSPMQMASEDFSHYLTPWRKGLYLFLGTGLPGHPPFPLHSPDFYVPSLSLQTGVTAMTSILAQAYGLYDSSTAQV